MLPDNRHSIPVMIRRYKGNRENYAAFQNAHPEYNMLEYRFEDIVSSEQTRRDVCDTLGLKMPSARKNFHPEKSIQNIGIHKKYHDQSLIRRLEDALPDYLVP